MENIEIERTDDARDEVGDDEQYQAKDETLERIPVPKLRLVMLYPSRHHSDENVVHS